MRPFLHEMMLGLGMVAFVVKAKEWLLNRCFNRKPASGGGRLSRAVKRQ